MRRVLGAGIVATLFVLGSSRAAQAQDNGKDMGALIKTFTDSGAKLEERESALASATALCRNKGGPDAVKRTEAFKKEIPGLLTSVHAKRLDPSYNKFTILCLLALEPLAPYPDLAPLIRPYLKLDTPEIIHMAALESVETHGASGLVKEIVAVLEEPIKGSARKDKGRERIERAAVRCTTKMPANEAVPILACALRKSHYKGVKLQAVKQLGELQSTRQGFEMNKATSDEAEKCLKEVSLTTYPDLDVSVYAALTLMRFGSWDGIAQVMERIKADKRGGPRETYKTVCTAARKTKGFLDVPPERFYEIDAATRASVLSAINEWWEKARTTKPDAGLFQAMRDAGLAVPADPDSKEAVSVLIDGLLLENREVRYEALDMLIRKTGRVDFGKTFKTLTTGGNGPNTLRIDQEEPMEGFPEGSPLAARLFEQQKQKAKDFKSWWDANSGRATWDKDKKAWIVAK